MFLAKTSSAAEWRAVSSAIKTLVEEATFEASNEALTFRAMDPSHVAVIDLNWPGKAFERYECDRLFRFSVRVEDFVKLIGRTEAKDSIEMTSSEEEGALLLRLTDGYKREFEIHLIESASVGTSPLPRLDFDVRLVMNKTSFERVLTDISVVSQQVTLSASKDGVSFSGESEVGGAKVRLSRDGAEILGLDVKQDAAGSYNLEYLLSISKAVGSVSDVVVCEYSANKPAKLELKLNEQGARIDQFLAPRVSGS